MAPARSGADPSRLSDAQTIHSRPKTPRPGDIEVGELRRLGSQLVEAIADYHAHLDDRPVLPHASPGEVAARFAGELPEAGESPEALIADWRERVAPLLTAIGSPRHFAYVNGSGTMIGDSESMLMLFLDVSPG